MCSRAFPRREAGSTLTRLDGAIWTPQLASGASVTLHGPRLASPALYGAGRSAPRFGIIRCRLPSVDSSKPAINRHFKSRYF